MLEEENREIAVWIAVERLFLASSKIMWISWHRNLLQVVS